MSDDLPVTPANGVILAKLAVIDDTLHRLSAYLPVSFEKLEADWGLRKIAERSLQIMVEAMIDIAERFIALEGGVPPTTSVEAIERLQRAGIVAPNAAYARMVRFRNFLVHNYDSLDVGILYGVLTSHLQEFRTFIAEVKARAAGGPGTAAPGA
ncbi:MAG: DUF86 domain-containing protein [Myxococcota bacterium]|nr:DUF86 domain-containing protein [Myxococcota bacterium]